MDMYIFFLTSKVAKSSTFWILNNFVNIKNYLFIYYFEIIKLSVKILTHIKMYNAFLFVLCDTRFKCDGRICFLVFWCLIKKVKNNIWIDFLIQLWVSHKNIYMLSILNHINASLLTLKKSSCCACTFACTNLPLLMILWFWHWYTAVYIRWSYRYQYQRRNTRRNLCCCYRGQDSSARVL